jgi:predicted dinucleotide-binding enzyme
MTSATIFGTGNMGTAIGDLLAAGGASVEHLNTTSDTAAGINGDLVVLAVPYPALSDIVEKYADQLTNKIVVDITNPLDFETFDSLVVAPGSSAAAELASALPNAHVVKAFNTTFAGTLAARAVGPNKTTVLIAGNNADAKSTLANAVQAGGIDAVDAGSLTRAHELEAIGFLQLTLAASDKVGWTGGFGIVR